MGRFKSDLMGRINSPFMSFIMLLWSLLVFIYGVLVALMLFIEYYSWSLNTDAILSEPYKEVVKSIDEDGTVVTASGFVYEVGSYAYTLGGIDSYYVNGSAVVTLPVEGGEMAMYWVRVVFSIGIIVASLFLIRAAVIRLRNSAVKKR